MKQKNKVDSLSEPIGWWEIGKTLSFIRSFMKKRIAEEEVSNHV